MLKQSHNWLNSQASSQRFDYPRVYGFSVFVSFFKYLSDAEVCLIMTLSLMELSTFHTWAPASKNKKKNLKIYTFEKCVFNWFFGIQGDLYRLSLIWHPIITVWFCVYVLLYLFSFLNFALCYGFSVLIIFALFSTSI